MVNGENLSEIDTCYCGEMNVKRKHLRKFLSKRNSECFESREYKSRSLARNLSSSTTDCRNFDSKSRTLTRNFGSNLNSDDPEELLLRERATTRTFSSFFGGEKRFETIHDLVADGLITLYVDFNAKDYIEHMTLNAQRSKQFQPNLDDKNDGSLSEQKSQSIPRKAAYNTFKASECEKAHNFKTQTYYGPNWCHYCRNFMWGLKAQGVRCQDCSYDCHKQCSVQVPNDCSPDKKHVKRVFGVDLTTLIKAHDQRRPQVVESCVHEIENRGLEAEGLYRVPGFADDITYLQNQINKEGCVPDITEKAFDDINVICGLVKLYFRSLPIPVITFDLYDQFIAAVKLEDKMDIIQALNKAVKALPPAHFELLKYFCRHLQRLTKYTDKNLMSAENLGIVFGPTLMRAPDHLAMEAVGYIPYQKKIIQMLIEEQDVLFEK